MNRRKSKPKEKLNIAMFGQKRIPSREGGVEIVVEELCTRMVAQGHNVTCYNRGGHHVSGSEYDSKRLISFNDLIKCGWNNLDNSTIMLLRLLDKFHLDSIALAGFDGYDVNIKSNYATNSLELSNVRDNPMELNEEIHSMLEDYKATRNSHTKIQFITPSRFSEIFDEGIQ